MFMNAPAECLSKSGLLPQRCGVDVNIDPQLTRKLDRLCADRGKAAVIDRPLFFLAVHIVKQHRRRLEMRAAWPTNQGFHAVELIAAFGDTINGLKANRELVRV